MSRSKSKNRVGVPVPISVTVGDLDHLDHLDHFDGIVTQGLGLGSNLRSNAITGNSNMASISNSNSNQRVPAVSVGKISGRERTLTVGVVLLSILCFGLVAYIVVDGPLGALLTRGVAEKGFSGICDSIECVDIAYRSVHSGDFSLDPCDDFYSFACSKWQAENPTSQEQFLVAANINQIVDRVDKYIKTLLEKPLQNASENVSAARTFYDSCLNYTSPDEMAIIKDLVGSLGGYKTDKSYNSQSDLTSVILHFFQLNAAPLFDLTLDIDPKNKTKYALIVELPRPTSLVPNLLQPLSRQDDFLTTEKLSSDLKEASDSFFVNGNSHSNGHGHGHDGNYGNESDSTSTSTTSQSAVDRQIIYNMIMNNVEMKRMEKLKVIVQKIGKLFNLSEDDVESDAKFISLLAQNIEKIKPSFRSRKFWKQQNKVFNEFSVKSLQTLFSNIDWTTLLEKLTMKNKAAPKKRNFSWEEVTIYVPYPDYLRRLSQALQYTDKRLVHNGMLVMYIKDMLDDLMKKDGEPRWKFCVHSTKSVFAMELSSLYMRSFPPAHLRDMRQNVEEIFLSVKESLMSFLNRSEWQDAKSRRESMRKIRRLKGSFIGPPFYLGDDYLDKAVKDKMKIVPNNFFANVKLVYKIFREQLYALYWKPLEEDRATWAFVTFPTTVNAFYIPQFNSIVIPLAFLNPPQYVHGAPKYINYATIAMTIAHEALHSLDSSGSNFDPSGKLLHDGFDGVQRGFLKEKSSCLAKQYFDHFTKIMLFHQTNVFFQVDGNLTQNENLADIAGLQVALNAYRNLRTRTQLKIEKQKIPGLSLNHEQLYFLAVAQAYCATISPMGYIFLLEMDEHTPHPERINGMLMNIPEFSKAYNCPRESKMNPTAKCSLW